MKTAIFLIFMYLGNAALGQQFQLSGSTASFFSSAPMEDIEASSTKTRSLFNIETGEIAFVIPIRSFEFRKKLMQEHFNENYLESHKYPNATFKGYVTGYDRTKKGKQKVKASGELTIHGVTHELETPGTLEVHGKTVKVETRFPVTIADYRIEIPQLLFYNIAEEVEIIFKGTYEPYEN